MKRLHGVILLLCLSVTAAACADDPAPAPAPETHQPVGFELGVGVGSVRFPAYAGAAEYRYLTVPFPYVVYHSAHLDVDHNQVRGKLLRNGSLSLDVDFGGDVSVDSSSTQERRGMPDLDWMGEVGPALRYHAWRGDQPGNHVDLVLPLRIADSVRGFDFTHRGWILGPRIEWQRTVFDAGDRIVFDNSLTADFMDRGYAGYYYSVAPQYATAIRPAYTAPAGYAGWDMNLGLSWHHGDLVFGTFVDYQSLKGAVFAASPLITHPEGFSVGVALSWILQRPQ